MSEQREKHYLTISTSNPGVNSTADLRFMVGANEVKGVHSVKFGYPDGDGYLRPADLVQVTITALVRLGPGEARE